MKKILALLIILMLSFSTVSSQSFYKKQQTETYIDWKLTNDGCYGCASFYWCVYRTWIPSMQQYKFNIWFQSNSFYTNGQWASTYVQGLYFNVDGTYLYANPSWMLFKDKYTSTLSSFYTTNANPFIKMTWSSMSVY